MKLSERVTLFPFLHGKLSFAQSLRGLLLKEKFDCIAVDLPAVLGQSLREAIGRLPQISAVVAEGMEKSRYFLPADPCDAAVEAVRQAGAHRTALSLIGYPELSPPDPLPPLPDEYAANFLGDDAFNALALLASRDKKTAGDLKARYSAQRLLDLSQKYRRVLAVVHLRRAAALAHHFSREETHNAAFPQCPEYRFRVEHLHPDHLYFALGELPFVTGRYEIERADPFGTHLDPAVCVKELFLETRDHYLAGKTDSEALPAAKLALALRFLRNLTVSESRLIPGLFDIVAAAKGVGGNAFALNILKAAKYYPFFPVGPEEGFLSLGIDRLRFPDENESRPGVHLLRDTALEWKTLSLKPDPSLAKKKRYRFAWNPNKMCSHLPEDRRIEGFNAHVRRKAKRVMNEAMARSEKFTASVKDGLDIRETLRHWHTGGIYVKEFPPARGDLDTVVIIFDEGHDETYSHLAVWYAEHEEESTLAFYATDPFANLMGPGIAQCSYGGLALIFPPRPIPNFFEITRRLAFKTLAEQLTYGGLLYSKEKTVAYVSGKRPGVRLKQLAARMGKRLVHIPLASFSQETLGKLRRFHVLNGKEVRSWAARFIGGE